MQIYQFI